MNEFGFVRATDPTTAPSTGSMVRASFTGVSPNNMSEYSPDGPAIVNLDGSTSFPKLSSFMVHYEAIYIQDSILMYNEYVAAASLTNALVWVRRFNKKSASWETVLATMQPILIGETVGQVYKTVEIRFDGVGVNTNYSGFVPGQQDVSTSSGAVTESRGGYGRGYYGRGVYGH
jgi:hypothetical protein